MGLEGVTVSPKRKSEGRVRPKWRVHGYFSRLGPCLLGCLGRLVLGIITLLHLINYFLMWQPACLVQADVPSGTRSRTVARSGKVSGPVVQVNRKSPTAYPKSQIP